MFNEPLRDLKEADLDRLMGVKENGTSRQQRVCY
jgi:hypothetical protein